MLAQRKNRASFPSCRASMMVRVLAFIVDYAPNQSYTSATVGSPVLEPSMPSAHISRGVLSGPTMEKQGVWR